jgi:KAP family P-loop domain.
VVQLLESVKNFLHAPNCVWVFAMDSGVIASYIDRKYEGTQMDGNSYLDKIVPEQYHIPRISTDDMTRIHRFLAMVQPANMAGLPVIDLRKVPQLPEVLVPRRLLKTAHKFYEVYASSSQLGGGANPDLVFMLILLYNTWPAFYERFSSGSVEHVRSILANFTEKDQQTIGPIPISNKFTEDRALKHYLNHCFMQEQNADAVCSTLVHCMMWLREVGLP